MQVPEDYYERVKEIHEKGGHGSIGYGWCVPVCPSYMHDAIIRTNHDFPQHTTQRVPARGGDEEPAAHAHYRRLCPHALPVRALPTIVCLPVLLYGS